MKYLSLVLALALMTLTGCGGAGNSTPDKGRLSISISWPKPTRLIPTSAQSITIFIDANSATSSARVVSQTVKRPADGWSTTTTTNFFLPVGALTVSANAYPTTDGSGVSQAFGQVPIQITATTNAQVTLSLSSTVAQLVVNPPNPTVAMGTPQTASVTPLSALGEVVLITSAAGSEPIAWQSSNIGVLTVTTPGVTSQLTGIATGTSTLTASMKIRDDGTLVSGATVVTVTTSGNPGTYHVIDLGSFGQSSTATCINDAGQVAGYTDTPDAFLYSNGTLTHLTAFSSYVMTATGINNKGQVAGFARSFGAPTKGFFFDGASIIDIGALAPGGETWGQAIDSAGDIIGYGDNAPGGTWFPIRWASGTLTNLSAQLTGTNVEPACVNDNGDIAGTDYPVSGLHGRAFLYTNGAMLDLGDLGGGDAYATGANSLHQVVGYSTLTNGGPQHAFLYDSAGIHDLGTLQNGQSQARGINDAGQIVGFSASGGAFIYTKATGMKDLNSLLDTASTGWVLAPNAINNHGWIAGFGTNPAGKTHAFLAIPN